MGVLYNAAMAEKEQTRHEFIQYLRGLGINISRANRKGTSLEHRKGMNRKR